MRYLAGISDGMHWDAGGSTVIEADSLDEARRLAEEWADDGDYPVSPAAPPAVELSLRDGYEVVARWRHTVPASACTRRER